MPITSTADIDFDLSKIHYKEAKLGDLIRACFSGVANNPAKSMLIIVTDDSKRYCHTLLNDLCRTCFGTSYQAELREMGIRKPLPNTIRSYFEEGIGKLSYFSDRLRQKKRVKRKTGLVEKEVLSYSKTLDGFLFADPLAYNAIMASSDPDIHSSVYEVFGRASSKGEVDSPSTVLLMLTKLAEEFGEREVTVHEFVDDIFDFKGKRRSTDYNTLKERVSGTFLRLKKAGLAEYDAIDTFSGECNTYGIASNADPLDPEIMKKLSKEYSTGVLEMYRSYAKRIVSLINQGFNTSRDIAKESDLAYRSIVTTLGPLRRAGVIGLVEGKEVERRAVVRLLPAGTYYYQTYVQPMLVPLEFFSIAAGKVKQSILGETTAPNIDAMIKLREELIDPLYQDSGALNEFRKRCVAARIRHQVESTSIARFII